MRPEMEEVELLKEDFGEEEESWPERWSHFPCLMDQLKLKEM